MKIILNLSRYCIETASKKKHDRLVIEYFKTHDTEQKKKIEHQINALKYLLENADFSALRYDCSRFDLNKEVILTIPPQFKNMRIHSNDTKFYPKWKLRI